MKFAFGVAALPWLERKKETESIDIYELTWVTFSFISHACNGQPFVYCNFICEYRPLAFDQDIVRCVVIMSSMLDMSVKLLAEHVF